MVAGPSRVPRVSSRRSLLCGTGESRSGNAAGYFVGEQSRDPGSRFLAADQTTVEARDSVHVTGKLHTRGGVEALLVRGDHLEFALVEDRHRLGPADHGVLLERPRHLAVVVLHPI